MYGFKEEKLVMTNKIYTINEIKEMCYEIFKEHKIEKAYIFGSYATNSATETSDIDIMIKKYETFTLLNLTSLENSLMKKLKKEVDIVTEETYTDDIKFDTDDIKNAKSIFFDIVKKERIQIYG